MIAGGIGMNYWDKNPAGINLFKVSNRSNRTRCKTIKVNNKRHQNDKILIVIVSLLLILNRFDTLF